MERQYLLTFLREGIAQFEWFNTLEEMQEFIDDDEFTGIYDALKIYDYEDARIQIDRKKWL